MEQNLSPKDDAIEYFKADINTRETSKFSSIFWGCPKSTPLSFWVIISCVLGTYFIFSIFISNILFYPMSVKGISMYPTLNKEYTISGNGLAQDVVYLWRTQNVKDNDIIVFDSRTYINSSEPEPEYYIKRVIATAGETIQFVKINQTDNTCIYAVLKNGVELTEEYINEPITYHSIASTPAFILDEAILTIPENTVFVMGDNRNHSDDSRVLGYISTTDIVGKLILHVPYGKTIIHGLIQSVKQDYLF